MHTLAWVAWVFMVMAIALSATNPFYLGIVLLSIILVAVLAPKTGTGVAGFRALLVLGVGLLAISLGVAVINGNAGSHVLFTIPGPQVPGWLGGLRVGGPVTAEGLATAGVRGLAILSVFLAFAAFNGAVSPHRVLRTAPAALFHAGLVVTIGLTLLPSSIEDIRRIREVQALRGARTGFRQLPALVVPAVIGGLERSMRLAEAMEARGYGAAPPARRSPQLVGALSAPLLLGAAWGWFYYEPARPFAALALALGLAALACWAWDAAHSRHTTRLRNEPIAPLDRFAIAFSVAVAVAVLAGVDLTYNPFAAHAWPSFSAGGALVALAAAWPALRLAFVPARAAAPAGADGPLPAEALGQ